VVSRRGMFEAIFSAEAKTTNSTSQNLDEFTQPLTRNQVRHLLRRATFGMSAETIDKYVGKRPAEIVDDLFRIADNKVNPNPPFFVNDTFKNPLSLSGKQRDAEQERIVKHGTVHNENLGEWWVKLLKTDHDSILEKMVLFWHDHFATQYAICNGVPAQSMFMQNDLFRKNYAGSFRLLLEKMSVDGAMLLYLNGNENVAEAPNENYARELLELFALGVGNYSEQDIKQAAKILTGWRVNLFSNEVDKPNVAYLVANNFDTNTKLFMGEAFKVDYEVNTNNVYQNSVKKLISVILSKKGDIAANFIAKKLYEYFIYSNPAKVNEAFIKQMADLLIQNNFELKPLLKALLKSKHFFENTFIGSQPKSPTDTIINFQRHLNYPDAYARNIMAALGQELLNPPNVAGWKGYRNWISTKSVPSTIHFLKEIINNNNDTQLGTWAQSIKKYDDLSIFTSSVSELFLVQSDNPARLTKYKNVLLANAPDYEWYDISRNTANLGQRLRKLLFEIIKAPDFFLM
jgi:uncharacterized protein (DUF1800 family)